MKTLDDKIDGPSSDNGTHHHEKTSFLKRIQSLFKIRFFIETGTADGNMVNDLLESFEFIWSVEGLKDRADKAKERCLNKHVEILHGCSGDLMLKLCEKLPQEACLFYLDGHQDPRISYPENVKICPLLEELTAIFKRKIANDVIIIDDLHLIGNTDGWPSLVEIQNLAESNQYQIEIAKNRNALLLKRSENEIC